MTMPSITAARLVALALALLALTACQSAPPQPFPDGAPTRPPQGCESLRERGGEC